ncbi:MAG TPA: hypothetical protein VJB57_19880 [Dehalococcoidia bacterium]|nr:hypothetical protein [Dehalococcoidia bacterium]
MPRDHTGLLIIRAWVEQGSSKPLRAHIRLTTDIAAGFASEMTLAEIHAVSGAVEAWLQAVLSDGRSASSAGQDAVTLS